MHAQKTQKAQKAQKVKKEQKEQNAQKVPKSTRKNQKHKNANERTKIKNAIKKHLREKSHLFAYLRFCACKEKKIEKSVQWKCWSH